MDNDVNDRDIVAKGLRASAQFVHTDGITICV